MRTELSCKLKRASLTALAGLTIFSCSPEKKKEEKPAEKSKSSRDVGIEYSEGVKLVLLGTGTPIPEPENSGPASAVIAGGRAFLIDAGAGVIRRAQKACRMGVWQLCPARLGVLFITHLHSDHTLGYPDFLFTPWIVGRDRPVEVFGPKGTKEMTESILEAWKQDLAIREKGGRKTGLAELVNVHEIEEQVIYETAEVKVSAFRVSHGEWEYAFGYRFDTGGRSIVFSGDTAPDESVIEACNGCDILVHEVYSHEGFIKGPESWREYHSSFHTSSIELARIAKEANPGRLIMIHKLLFGQTEEGLLREVTSRYKGEVHMGQDLDMYRLSM